MAVLTISRELGSRGRYVGEKVAEALNYPFVDKESIELVLRDYRLQTPFLELHEAEPGLRTRFDYTRALTLEMLDKVILALAQHDKVVILDRGGYAVLQDFANVLNVRVQAPFSIRVPRIMKQLGIVDRDEAEAFLKKWDHLRTAFVESSYHVRWSDSSAFDLVIDTGKVHPEIAVDWVVEAIDSLEERERGDDRTTRSIEVDSVLKAKVSEVLRVPEAHAAGVGRYLTDIAA